MTNDLISRQAAINAILGMFLNIAYSEKNIAWSMALDKIRQLPTAEPEIIRCKDCNHYQFADNRAFGTPVKMCEWFGFEDVDDDDFCSRAERRTNG